MTGMRLDEGIRAPLSTSHPLQLRDPLRVLLIGSASPLPGVRILHEGRLMQPPVDPPHQPLPKGHRLGKQRLTDIVMRRRVWGPRLTTWPSRVPLTWACGPRNV